MTVREVALKLRITPSAVSKLVSGGERHVMGGGSLNVTISRTSLNILLIYFHQLQTLLIGRDWASLSSSSGTQTGV